MSSVILDFGGVLGLPQDPARVATMSSLCRLSAEEFHRLYQRDRLDLDRGTLSTEEYWVRILRSAGMAPTPALIAQIEEEDSLGWTRINKRVVDWAAELRAAGYATAILSNMPSDKLAFMRRNPAFDWIHDFPVAIFSCDHNVVKPEPAIYRLCLQLLGKDPDECVFLDDSVVNVEGGREAGIAALHFRSRWGLPVRNLLDDTPPSR